jgi:CO/xanthine dehydrogenase Mo-binding subunit
MMETYRSYTHLDRYGRLHVITSTQIVFHARRILAEALGIPKSMIRVEKPRVGGGFGAKSIGEIVINTPGPAIAHAIYRATGKWFRELPITPEQIAMSLIEE